MKKSLIFGVLALTIVGLLSFAGGRASNSVASKSSNNKTESSYNSNKNTNNGVDKVVTGNGKLQRGYDDGRRFSDVGYFGRHPGRIPERFYRWPAEPSAAAGGGCVSAGHRCRPQWQCGGVWPRHERRDFE